MKKGLLILVALGALASFAACAKKDTTPKHVVKKEKKVKAHKLDGKEMAGYKKHSKRMFE